LNALLQCGQMISFMDINLVDNSVTFFGWGVQG
jgi:hypothetical protein